jgi:hypothetical protein
LGFAACGEDSATAPELPSLSGSMSAVVDGQPWTATIALTAAVNGGILGFAGSDADQTTIGMAMVLAGPGTYVVEPNSPTNATYTEAGAAQWAARTDLGSGSITLTTTTESRAVGTFEFTVAPDVGNPATGTKQITQGRFDVTF